MTSAAAPGVPVHPVPGGLGALGEVLNNPRRTVRGVSDLVPLATSESRLPPPAMRETPAMRAVWGTGWLGVSNRAGGAACTGNARSAA